MAEKTMDKALNEALDNADGLVDMKRTKKEKKETNPVASDSYDGPDYDYGLRLRLDDDALTKLDMDLPKVGSKVRVDAIGEVCEVSQHESDRDTSRTVEIQIQKLSIGKGK